MLGQYYKQKKRNRLKLNNYTEENFNLLNTLLYILKNEKDFVEEFIKTAKEEIKEIKKNNK